MFARGAFSLFLLLLSVSLPTHVQSQTVTVSEVSTEYIEVTWKRQLQWIGVEDYNVTFTSEGGADCFKTITCTTVTCTFNSVQCGLVPPCTPTNVTVSGDSHTAPTISLVTGPDKITELAQNITDGTLYVSWANPSTDSSPCYENTAVRIDYRMPYNFQKEYIRRFGHEEVTTNYSLCVEGTGELEVWTEGGDGPSNSSLSSFVYTGSDLVKLVTIETCKPVNCTAIEVEWSYVPVCPNVGDFLITMGDDIVDTAPINSTNITMTDLISGEGYMTYVIAVGHDGWLLDRAYKYCYTADEVLENLTAEALSTSSLRVTWDPVVCPKSEHFMYELTVNSAEPYSTTANEYIVENLSSFHEYRLYLRLIDDLDSFTDTSTHALTKPDSPQMDIWIVDEYFNVLWSFSIGYTYGYDFYYKLTWGKNLQHEEITKDKNFIITDFNSTDEVFMVCVAAIPEGREDLASDADCKNVADAKQRPEEPPNDGLSGGAIAGIVIGSVLGLGLLVGLLVACSKNNSSNTRTQQTQQQQHGMQQQRMQEYKYGVYNPAASQ